MLAVQAPPVGGGDVMRSPILYLLNTSVNPPH